MTSEAGRSPLFSLNPHLQRDAATRAFRETGRVQIRDFLLPEAAGAIHKILSRETPWGLAWQAGEDGPHRFRRHELAELDTARRQAMERQIGQAMRGRDYAFLYAQYAILNAYLEEWREHEGLDLLIEHVNDEPLMELVREVTGAEHLVKADAQATLYAPNQFLAVHDDQHSGEDRKVAYVMNFCADDWRPDWGGYLNFFDEDGDVIAGFKPRFNALNLFRVPQRHNVSYVAPFAPVSRFAITGWFRAS